MYAIQATSEQVEDNRKVAANYWLENPLKTWRIVKAVMQRRELLRVQLSMDERCPRYAGYLMPASGNLFLLVKFGRADRKFTYAELMGLCLGAKLWVDSNDEMPEYYRKFTRLCRLPEA